MGESMGMNPDELALAALIEVQGLTEETLRRCIQMG